jgi:Tfp pilus assembly protein PilV
MIKKLKIKFVLITMTIVSVLLCAVFVMIYAQTYQKAQAASINAMQKAIENHTDSLNPSPQQEDDNSPPQNQKTRCRAGKLRIRNFSRFGGLSGNYP